MNDSSTPDPSHDQRILEGFLSTHSNPGAADLEAWMEGRPEIGGEPGLPARLRQALDRHLRLDRILQELPVRPDSSASFFRAGAGLQGKSQDSIEEKSGFRVGQRIGHFCLRRFIDRGGMGQVWEASDDNLRTIVALKLVLPERVNARTLDLFAREARAGGRLNHPSIVRTLAYGSDDGLSWIAQELIEGSWTLKDFLDEVRASDRVPNEYYRHVADFVAKLADGLSTAHAAGVIHRDVKPQNILIDSKDTPKLTDFGLARVIDDSVESRSGDFAGTFAYMSPEQVTAKRMGLDHRTDVFSLGVVLYEMLALRRPFDGDTTHQIATRIITFEPPAPSKVRSQCPTELATIVGKALEKDPGRRYQTMQEFGGDLRRHLANESIMARPPGVFIRAGKLVQRNPARSAAGAIGLVALAVVCVLLFSLSRSNKRLKDQTQVATEQARTAREQSELATKRGSELERVAYMMQVESAAMWVSQGEIEKARQKISDCPKRFRSTWEWSWLNAQLDVCTAFLSRHADDLDTASFSPDGNAAVIASEGNSALVWDMASCVATAKLEGHTEGVTSTSFSSDGSRIATSSNDNTARVWDAETGHVLTVLEGHEDGVYTVAFSPDDSQVVTGSSDGTARIWDVASGALLLVLQGHTSHILSAVFSPDGRKVATTSWDDTARVWDAATGELIAVLEGHEHGVTSAAFNLEGNRVLTGSLDGTVRLWDAVTGNPLETRFWNAPYEGSPMPAFDSSGLRPTPAFRPTLVSAWGPVNGDVYTFSSLHDHDAGAACFGSDSQLIVTTSNDKSAHLWSTLTGQCLLILKGHSNSLTSVALSPRNDQVATASLDKTVRVWDAVTGDTLAVLEGHSAGVNSVAFGPGGNQVVSASQDNIVRIWDAVSGEPLQLLQGHTGEVYSANYSFDGERIVSASSDGTVRVWDASSGESLLVLQEHTARVNFASFSPDGICIVSASSDKTSRIWDAETGEVVTVLEGHSDEVFSASYNPDGTRIVTSSLDGTTLVWDAETGRRLVELNIGSDAPGTTRFSPDGVQVFTGSAMEGSRFWDSKPYRDRFSEIEEARHNFAENLPLIYARLDAGKTSKEIRRDLSMDRSLSRGELHACMGILRTFEDYIDRLLRDLFRTHDFMGPVLSAIQAEPSLTPWIRRALLDEVQRRGELSARDCYRRGWTLLRPEPPPGVPEDKFLQGVAPRAVKYARRAVELYPGDPGLRDLLAWALLQSGDSLGAFDAGEKAVDLAGERDKRKYERRLQRLRVEAQQDEGE